MTAKIWAIVPAGGHGARMKLAKAKQYLMLSGSPVIEHSIKRLASVSAISRIVVGIANDDKLWEKLDFKHQKLLARVDAGTRRADTVANCLQFIVEQGGKDDWALVHDAVRPCVRPNEVQHLINEVLQDDIGGILALPLSDTLKRGSEDEDPRIVETVPRDHLWRAMTPQMFKVSALLAAIGDAKKAKCHITDEASAIEAAGKQPILVPCSPDNIKITYPQDLKMAEMILSTQLESAQ